MHNTVECPDVSGTQRIQWHLTELCPELNLFGTSWF
jgi:hypothetical protein